MVKEFCVGVFIDAGGEVVSGDHGEAVFEVGGEVYFTDGISIGKDVKGGVDVRIYDSVGWGVYRDVCDWFCRVVDVDVNISMFELVIWVFKWAPLKDLKF